MFGYATRETDELMPLPISLAHQLAHRLADVRHAGRRALPAARTARPRSPSATSTAGPVEIEKLLISTQHREGAESLIPDDLWEHVVEPVLPRELYDAKKLRKRFLVNPTGRFVIGGPVGDCGLTGPQDHRRHLRRHGPPRRRRVQRQGPEQGRPLGRLRRALGGQEHRRRRAGRALRGAGRLRDRRGQAGVGDGRDASAPRRSAARASRSSIDEHFDLRPGAFREELRLHRPIYQKTAAYGHFGREDHDFTWERTDKAEALRTRRGWPRRAASRSAPVASGRQSTRAGGPGATATAPSGSGGARRQQGRARTRRSRRRPSARRPRRRPPAPPRCPRPRARRPRSRRAGSRATRRAAGRPPPGRPPAAPRRSRRRARSPTARGGRGGRAAGRRRPRPGRRADRRVRAVAPGGPRARRRRRRRAAPMPGGSSASTEPPKPPPTIRAPAAPASTSAVTVRSTAGTEAS